MKSVSNKLKASRKEEPTIQFGPHFGMPVREYDAMMAAEKAKRDAERRMTIREIYAGKIPSDREKREIEHRDTFGREKEYLRMSDNSMEPQYQRGTAIRFEYCFPLHKKDDRFFSNEFRCYSGALHKVKVGGDYYVVPKGEDFGFFKRLVRKTRKLLVFGWANRSEKHPFTKIRREMIGDIGIPVFIRVPTGDLNFVVNWGRSITRFERARQRLRLKRLEQRAKKRKQGQLATKKAV